MVKMGLYLPFEEDGVEASIKEFGEANGLDYLEAQGFIKTLVKLGVAKQTSSRKVAGQKGKPTNVYTLPSAIQVNIWKEAAKEAAA